MYPLFVYEEGFTRPLILAGKKAFIVLARNGELSVPWYRWGSQTDYGGFYAPPQRVTGPVRLGIWEDETLVSLVSRIVRGEYFPGYAIFYYETEGFSLKKTVFLPERIAGATIIFTIKNKRRKETNLHLTVFTESWLSNIDFDGLLPENPTVAYTTDKIVMSSTGLYGALASNLSFNKVTIGEDNITPPELEATPTSYKDRTRKVLANLNIPLEEGGEKTLILALGASSERKDEAVKVAENILENCFTLLEEKKIQYKRFLDSTVTINTPDRMVNQAFKSALVAIEALKAEPAPGMIGVYAGYPWFVGFWGRDIGWILPAFLAIGDFEGTKRSLNSLLKNQARHDYDLLHALKGEIPMLYGHKTTFFYGSADSTLYYPPPHSRLCR